MNLVAEPLGNVPELVLLDDAVVVVVEDQEDEVDVLRGHVRLHQPHQLLVQGRLRQQRLVLVHFERLDDVDVPVRFVELIEEIDIIWQGDVVEARDSKSYWVRSPFTIDYR